MNAREELRRHPLFGIECKANRTACIRIQREVTAGEGLTDEEKETVC